jgi:polyphosphate glucokinase
MTSDPSPSHPRTLAVDIGGTGIKAVVFDADGVACCGPVRVETPYPCPPARLVEEIQAIASGLVPADRVGAGFPGLIRSDRVVWVNSLTRPLPGEPTDELLAREWVGHPLQASLSRALGLPCMVANDADVHALASVSGQGMECVVTLGTGLGFSLVMDGMLLPHLEFGGLPCVDDRDYDTALGQAGLEQDGPDVWVERVRRMCAALRQFLYFDHLYLGGGNARLLPPDVFSDDVTRIDNVNGLFGAHRLWAGTAGH